MLLVERTLTKAGRAGLSAEQAMELPVALLGAFDVDARLSVSTRLCSPQSADSPSQAILEVVQEVDRLVDDLSRTDKEAFLSQT